MENQVSHQCNYGGFDATYRSNKYDMVFVPFTGIDNHNRNVTLGAALLGSETAESYSWLLRFYVKAFGCAPKVIVTDQDPAMKKAIQEVLPNSRHRLCMWHIWEKLSAKLGLVVCYMAKADEIQVVAPPPSRRDRFAEMTGMKEPCTITVRNPIRTRTKGCHNLRICKLYIASLKGKGSTASSGVDNIQV
ncbi:hypothetical protein L1987_33322 [Smallanthus sonchifolius]|uniref:Uncharacterized protein n=1 Tax=Smallanthus sonchifolius TaxID=185202 RepID=A0ACB9HS27_9ASTR|nr:hypothetical protein L1987_33322 [Smallanthus sonchifolius]